MLLSACTARAAFTPSQARRTTAPRQKAVLAPQRRHLRCRAADELLAAAAVEPEDARGALAIGLKFSNAGNWEQAQEYFERALELPGSGVKRWRDKPPALSEGELTSALYNIACCRSQLGDIDNGMVAIAGAVEQGYRNFAQLRADPDLQALREDARFEGVMKRFERPAQAQGKGFLGLF